ncbi:MAG: acetyl-CoA carboxylase biotin carboxyl carrier protein subunit [Acidobacteria bacterium]|nr:MAG: acetyl-CoA carboxylase biotin carboxyl carrier protein subunit [Acidobacteriota bacterium]RLE20849.1 MAG: acetyl-CoA carboxylase biotin carboxyl carrier protein subunit [Acidobacteriota bacterium]
MLVSVEMNGKSVEVEVRERPDGRLQVNLDGKDFQVEARELPEGGVSLMIDNESLTVYRTGDTLYIGGTQYRVRAEDPLKKELLQSSSFQASVGTVTAVMPGNVKKILAGEGMDVQEGQGVVVLEAMKMENELEAPLSGIVKKMYVSEGQSVEAGTLLFEIE